MNTSRKPAHLLGGSILTAATAIGGADTARVAGRPAAQKIEDVNFAYVKHYEDYSGEEG